MHHQGPKLCIDCARRSLVDVTKDAGSIPATSTTEGRTSIQECDPSRRPTRWNLTMTLRHSIGPVGQPEAER